MKRWNAFEGDSELKMQKLEHDRQSLFSRVSELERLLSTEKESQIATKAEQEKKIAEWTREKNDLLERNLVIKQEYKSVVSVKDLLIQELQAKTDAFQSYISDLEKKAQENIQSQRARNDAIERLGNYQNRSISSSGTNLTRQEQETLFKQLKDNLNHVTHLEKEIVGLKKELDHYKSLDLNLFKKQEEIVSLNNQVAQLSALRGELAAVQSERALLLHERARWSKFCQEEQGMVDPVILSRSLAQARLECAQLKQELGEEKAAKTGRQGYITRLEEDVQKFKVAQRELDLQNQNLQKQLKIQERAKKLAQRESEFLRNQLVFIRFK